MFGEVAEDTSRPITSHYMTTTTSRASSTSRSRRRRRASPRTRRRPTSCATSSVDDDWYTDADSNVYNLPTFLGNHDSGRIGMFLRNANPGASEAELLARDQLAHELMYFSRGNPVVYYGDEQGFTGAGGDQDARQDMFPSQVAAVQQPQRPGRRRRRRRQERQHRLRRDADGRQLRPRRTRSTGSSRSSRELTRQHPRAARRRPAAPLLARRRRASTRSRASTARPARVRRRAQQLRAGRVRVDSDVHARGEWKKLYGDGPARLRSGGDAAARRDGRAALGRRLPRRRTDPAQPPGAGGRGRRAGRRAATGSRSRADVAGDSFYEVTFLAQGRQRRVAGHRHRRQRAVPRVPRRRRRRARDAGPVPRGRARQRRPHARERRAQQRPSRRPRSRSRRRTRASACAGRSRCARPRRRSTRTTSCASSARSTAARSRPSGPTTRRPSTRLRRHREPRRRRAGHLPRGPHLRAGADRDERRPARSRSSRRRVTTAVIHYNRPDGDYAAWGLHLFGDGLARRARRRRRGRTRRRSRAPTPTARCTGSRSPTTPSASASSSTGRPPGDPNIKDTDPDRFFIPLATPEIWLRQGDTRIYSCAAANDTCVVPSA